MVEPLTLPMPLRQLQPFFAPDPLNLLMVYLSAFKTQQSGDLAIAVATVLPGQPDQCQPQSIVVFGYRLVLQVITRKPNHPTAPSLRRRELLARMDYGLTKLSRRQALGFK